MPLVTTWPVTIIRWLMFAPAVFYISLSLQYTSKILNEPALRSPPYSTNIRYGALFSNISSILVAVWSFLTASMVYGSSAPGMVLQGIVDFAVTAVIAVSVGFQSTYIPHTKGACKHVAETYHVPQNTSSLFRLVSSPNANATTVITTCKDFQTIWYTAVSISGLAALATILNIWLSGWWKHDSGVTFSSLGKTLVSSIKTVLFCIYQLIVMLCLIPWQLLKHFVVYCRPPGRFARRYFIKWKSRSRHRKVIDRNLERKLLDPRFHVSQTRQESVNDESEKKTVRVTYRDLSAENNLANLPYDITVLLCQHLHSIDVFNLGLTSKTIRRNLFGYDNVANRLSPQFQIYSCPGQKKTPCWSCGIQICSTCTFTTTCEGTPAAKHLRRCKPSCSKCYYKNTRKTFKTRPFIKTTCDVQHCTSGSWTYSSAPERSKPRVVCRTCSTADSAELTSMRNERDKVTIEKLGLLDPEVCYMCQKGLGKTGPRWWFCSVCHQECIHDFHPQWVGRKKVGAVTAEKC